MSTPIKLSILVPTVPSRIDNFFPRIITHLNNQVGERKDVEILGLFDNKRKTTGSKRQDLLNISRGEYVVFVDDDDRISDDYVSKIMEAIETNPGVDVINFQAKISINGGVARRCKFSTKYTYTHLPNGEMLGKTSHIMVWRAAIAKKHAFADMVHGEDVNWVDRAINDVTTEYCIDSVLYYYDANYSTTSETVGLSPEVIATNIARLKRENAFSLTKDFAIVLPTRKRPDELKRLVNSVMETADNPNKIEFCFYIDPDDNISKDCIEELIANNKSIKYISSDKNPTLSEMWNIALELSTADIIMHCGDDIVFRTKSWDTIVKSKMSVYKDKIVLAYGNDGYQGANLATHSFVYRKWIEASGFWLPPYFVSDFNDVWLDVVAKGIGRSVYIPEVFTEHMHYVVGKAKVDETTQLRLERHRKYNPKAIYNEKAPEREAHMQRLREYIASQHV